jgi:transposase
MAMQRRNFDREFREGAVRIVRETGKPIAQVARELGLHEGTLGRWVNLDRRAREGEGPLTESERNELTRLRKENAELAMERDVLKRSAALWVLSRGRNKTHYAEHRIMPRTPLNRLRGKGSGRGRCRMRSL